MFLHRRHGKLYGISAWRGDDGKVHSIWYRADAALIEAIEKDQQERAERKRLGAELLQTGLKLKALLNDQKQALNEVMAADGFHYCKGEWRKRRKVYTTRRVVV